MAASTTQPGNSSASPSSSPRLPSPPPFTEVQIGPKSPSISGAVTEFSLDNSPDDGASRRIRPGTKAADMAKGPPFLPLHKLDSAFQLQEYLKSLHAYLTRDEATGTVKPIDKEMAVEMATPPTAQDTGEVVDRNLWLYELCRFLCNKTTRLIVGFFHDNPPCSSQTCPEMRASEWQYLCAVHEPPKSCCAIDYCNHTLDWASNILSSSKHFPSRLSLHAEGGNAYQSLKQLTNIFRRVYRIYAHGWFQHREVFWTIEAETGLYMLFKTVCDRYQLIPEDNYTIPPEAEGEREDMGEVLTTRTSPEKVNNMSILRKGYEKPEQSIDEEATNNVSTGATTRRHKHTPSTGIPVGVIAEGHEEDEEETTMVDLGAPGPAEETGSSLSPPKARLERSKSPGFIEIPKTTDLDKAPEDPTPVAVYDSNPFGSPGPAEITESSASEVGELPPATALKLDSVDESTDASLDGPETAVELPDTTTVATDHDALGAVLDHMKEMDNPRALDSDVETQIAVEDAKHDDGLVEDDETMEKINLAEVDDTTESSEVKKDEKLADQKSDIGDQPKASAT